jgi:siroheme synthase (precorrin-2 oxidase/ferrochelatase)
LVVGAGEAGTRKTEGLIAAGAIVTIISPRASKKNHSMGERKKSLLFAAVVL